MDDLTALREELKHFMRRFPQGVTLVTTYATGRNVGITISSFTSISLNPPLILISISKDANSYMDFVSCDSFNVQLLAANQESIAERFAKKIKHEEKFSGLKYTCDSKRNPVIDGTIANLECSKFQVIDAGDHSLILGRVENANVLRDLQPLIYHERAFTTIREQKKLKSTRVS
jgi:flavin reductase (DIM6/NTAB) family NADH-FMN oxidoreductase RutF